MPVNHSRKIVLIAVLIITSAGVGATNMVSAVASLWPLRETRQSVLIADYRSLTCPKTPPAAYTGHLQVDSKYDQSDESKTTLTRLSKDSERIRDRMTKYHGGLQQAITHFERAQTGAEANYALACLDQWLDAWAEPAALMSRDVSGTGRAVRKWSLAALSSGLLKVRALSNGGYQLSDVQQAWLQQLADTVIEDYSPRQTLDFEWFNNHDYWAAWAVASTGMLIGNNKYLDWADKTLHLAFQQMEPGQAEGYVHLPLETARGQLAVDYTHYALVPLVLLTEAVQFNGRALSEDEHRKLGLLVNFAVGGVLQPDAVPELEPQQVRPSEHKMVWLLPFLKQQPGHELARKLHDQVAEDIGHYGQVGGNIRFFYSEID